MIGIACLISAFFCFFSSLRRLFSSISFLLASASSCSLRTFSASRSSISFLTRSFSARSLSSSSLSLRRNLYLALVLMVFILCSALKPQISSSLEDSITSAVAFKGISSYFSSSVGLASGPRSPSFLRCSIDLMYSWVFLCFRLSSFSLGFRAYLIGSV